MSLRPYWARHQVHLRIAGALVLIFSPLIVAWWAVLVCWQERGDIAHTFKEAWEYLKGEAK